MFRKHIGKELSAYCHCELAAQDSRRVAEHVIACRRCRSELEQVRLGVQLAEQLPEVPAPDALWDKLQLQLSARVGDNFTQSSAASAFTTEARRRWRFHGERRLRLAIAGVVLIIGLGFVWFYLREQRPSWEVARLDGTPRIGSSGITQKARLRVGQWLETDAASRAKIDVGSIGQVEIDPNTRVRLVATKPTEHRLELARGRMSARIWAPPKLFFVDTPSAVAEDLGCAYTLEVDDHGGSLLRVTLGWVSLQLKDRESMVPAGAACATRPGIGPGTPYFEDASDIFKQALSRFDFERNAAMGSGNMAPLEIVVANARPRDTLTLWHLLPRVEGNNRESVYERMAALVPPPEGVTRDGVLALDQQMLDAWKVKLQSTWNDNSTPSMLKFWKKIST
jgi:FecR protein